MSDVTLADALLDAPVVAPLDIRFANGERGDAGAALFFDRPNAMALEIVNRTIHDMTFIEIGDDHHLELAFRPHTLLAPEDVRLAPSSVADGWSLSAQEPAEHGHRQVYRLRRLAGAVLGAGAREFVQLEALRADPFGGARGTQASVDFAGLGLARDGTPLSGHLLLRLALLDAGDTAGATGSIGEGASDLFRARFSDGGATLLNDGTENAFRVCISNDSGGPLELHGGDDTAARFIFDTSDAERHGGTIEFAITNREGDVADGWESIDDGTVIRPREPYSWPDRRDLWFRVTMRCEIDHGRHPLRIRYENMPPEGQRGGAITLMQTFGPLAQINHRAYATKPLELIGSGGAVHFSYGDAKTSAARLWASQDEDTAGKLMISGDTGHGIEMTASRVSLVGGKLGIGPHEPQAPVHIQAGVSDTSHSGGGGLIIGSLDSTNVSIDNNEIMARNDGGSARLAINWNGGAVNIGGELALGQDEPEAPVHVQAGFSDVDLSEGGGVVIGSTSGRNIAIDDHKIVARYDGKPTTLSLNSDSGLTWIGGDTSVNGALSAGSLSVSSSVTANSVSTDSVSSDFVSAVSIEITGTEDLSLSTGSDQGLVIGRIGGRNLAMDTNEIMARENGEASALYINASGGTVFFGNAKSHGQFRGTLAVMDVPIHNGGREDDLTWHPDKLISREGSSKRYKKNIRLLKDDFEAVLKIKPRSFQMKKGFGDPETEMIGYIAEEMDELGLERLVAYDDEGRPDGVKYKKLAIYLTEVVKTQETRIAALEAAVAKLTGEGEPTTAPAQRRGKKRTGGA